MILAKSAIKPLVLPAFVLFFSLVLVVFASLHLEVLRHERMVPILNKALARNGLSIRVSPLKNKSFLFDAGKYRARLAPSVVRFPLDGQAGFLWVYVARAGGLNALLMVAEYPDGQFSSPIPCDEPSRRHVSLLPPGLANASLVRVKQLARGYYND